jgi:peptide/nickel transport system permease protein
VTPPPRRLFLWISIPFLNSTRPRYNLRMRHRLLRRLITAIPLLFGITFLSFLLMHTAQGDFLSSMQLNPQIDAATIEAARSKFGLDQPWYIQYIKWIAQIIRGNFGYSFAYQQPVAKVMGAYVTNTLLLSISALLIALVFAFPAGIIGAVKRNSWLDRGIDFLSTLGLSVPTLLLALLALLFAAKTHLFPVGGREQIDFADLNWLNRQKDLLRHLALPALVLAVNPAILYFRQLRSNLSSVLTDPYVMTARAKGLGPAHVILSHALRNALNPLISLFGFSLANLLNGAFLVEIIMSWPGLGRLTYDALLSRDLYLVMGSLTLASLMLIVGNLFADVLLTLNDPRIRTTSI